MVDWDPWHPFLANIYLLKVNNRDTRITFEICKIGLKDIRTRSRHHSGVFIVNFQHISHLLVFLLQTLSMYLFALCDLFYILIVFRFYGFKFYPFLERISTTYNISTKWNAEGADLKQCNEKCISIKFQ